MAAFFLDFTVFFIFLHNLYWHVMKTMIIGGGLAGLAVAYRLTGRDEVTVIEREEKVGGVAASYSVQAPHMNTGTYNIERYYHHILPAIKNLYLLSKNLVLKSGLSG